jgi:tRNA dimethylallyltransferase
LSNSIAAQPNTRPLLVILVGPTAVGKTAMAVNLAKYFDVEILSCDSRQFYKELNIGTAKPSKAEMKGVVHHFIDSHSVQSHYSAGDYERDVAELLKTCFNEKKMAILTGGSGLFVKAVVEGLDFIPATSLELRDYLMQKFKNRGLDVLREELKALDPVLYSQIDLRNSQRVVRALEVTLAAGKPMSDFQKKNKKSLPFDILKIAINRPRSELYERINARVDQMLIEGLVEEVRSLEPFKAHNALQTVGYKEVFSYLDGVLNYQEMVDLIKRNTRRYAKRQLTWFHNQDTFEWYEADEEAQVRLRIEEVLNDRTL